jgi:hypothetical protein
VLAGSQRGRPGLAIIALIVVSLVVFSAAYEGLALAGHQFSGLRTRLDALYFTMVTLSTVGFGDVTATGQAARAVVVVQIVYNFVFLTTGASALVQQMRGKVEQRHRQHGPEAHDPEQHGPQPRSPQQHGPEPHGPQPPDPQPHSPQPPDPA